MNAPLYNRELLALAVATAEFPPLPDATSRIERRAPLCGSRIWLDVQMADNGRIAAVGMAVEACVIGQAAATLMARGAAGRGGAELAAAHEDIAAWLAGDAPLPDWPGFAALAPARDYPARHGAILLPFSAAAAALADVPIDVPAAGARHD